MNARVSTKSESIYTTFIESWVYDEVTTIFHDRSCRYCWDNTIVHATYIRYWLSDPPSSDPQSNSDGSIPLDLTISSGLNMHFEHGHACTSTPAGMRLYGSCSSPRIPSTQTRSVNVLVDGVQETLPAAVMP